MHVLGPGGLVAAFVFGFRHGIDWDHLAALADITNVERDRRRAMRLSACYVVGHAVIILALGIAAIAFAEHLPTGIDGVMEKVVGVTLVVLGAVLLQSVVRRRHDPTPMSRWSAVREAAHRTLHRHAEVPVDPTVVYSVPAAVGVGMLHGIGAETPTQVLLFAGVAASGGSVTSLAILVTFVIGLVVANTVIAAGGALGFGRIGDRPRLAFGLSLFTAVFSIAMGALLIAGQSSVLPPILGG
jgi:high-affinity nickel-transport protein